MYTVLWSKQCEPYWRAAMFDLSDFTDAGEKAAKCYAEKILMYGLDNCRFIESSNSEENGYVSVEVNFPGIGFGRTVVGGEK